MSIIKVDNVAVSFGGHNVIRDISYTVERGEILTILGANGCGKSTLLRAMLGIQKRDQGNVVYSEQALEEFSPAELARKVAFLPQSATPPGDMTVEEWVGCGRYPYQAWWKPQSDYDRKIVQEALQNTRVWHLKDRNIQSLSGGERQRARIAMALAQEPEIIMLDEPTTYLDLSHQLEVMELLQRINRSNEVTVVMVLHDVNHAAKYSHRLLVLGQGGIYAWGAPQAILTEKLMRDVYGVEAEIADRDGSPYCYVDGLTRFSEQ